MPPRCADAPFHVTHVAEVLLDALIQFFKPIEHDLDLTGGAGLRLIGGNQSDHLAVWSNVVLPRNRGCVVFQDFTDWRWAAEGNNRRDGHINRGELARPGLREGGPALYQGNNCHSQTRHVTGTWTPIRCDTSVSRQTLDKSRRFHDYARKAAEAPRRIQSLWPVPPSS